MNFNRLFKRNFIEKRHKKIDFFTTTALILLLIFSCIMVYSASSIGNQFGIFTNYVPVEGSYFLKRQALWCIISLFSYFLFSTLIPYEILKENKIYGILTIFICFLLVIPLFMPSINGAYSWIRVGGATFQPSTIAQIFLIAYIALILNSRKNELIRPTTLSNITRIFAVPMVVLVIIYLQNDTGTIIITASVIILMILCANISFRNLFNLIKLATISAILLISILALKSMFSSGASSYRINRIKTFIDPFAGETNSDNHIINSMIAFGNGGLFGRGLGNSIQKLGYLPEAHTDFIMAVIAEETGFIGVIVVISLLIVIIYKVLYTGLKSTDTFDSIFCIGFAGLLSIQTIVNIGGISGSLPMTGVPIPYLSNGGSSLIILSTTLGISMNILSHIKSIKNKK